MENFYTAYTKQIDNTAYFFVKKFIRFPEFKNVADVLESYGMHTDFNKACAIAGITDPVIKQQLLHEIEMNTPQAKVIDLTNVNTNSKTQAG